MTKEDVEDVPNAPQEPGKARLAGASDRRAREAARLRENLGRRKEQARTRATQAARDSGPDKTVED